MWLSKARDVERSTQETLHLPDLPSETVEDKGSEPIIIQSLKEDPCNQEFCKLLKLPQKQNHSQMVRCRGSCSN